MATRKLERHRNRRGQCKKTCSDTGKETDTRKDMEAKQAMEDWDPGLGVVWWAVVAGERAVWSGALDVGE